jgi:putative ABC transport system substrate-binding protein
MVGGGSRTTYLSGLASVARGTVQMKGSTWPLALIGAALFASLLAACSVGAATSPTAAPVPRVALMHVGTDHIPPSLGTLVTQLGQLGWFDGSPGAVMQQLVGDGKTKVNGKMAQLSGEYDGSRIVLIWRNLEPEQVTQQAVDFVSQRVSVIVAFEDKSIAASQAATAQPGNQIPIVFLHPSDPVRQNLVDSLSHPGGNLTGVFGARDPIAKQVELYKEIMPSLQKLVMIYDPTDSTTAPLMTEATNAAGQLGIEVDQEAASDDASLQQVFQAIQPGQSAGTVGAFLVSPSLRLNHSAAAIDDSGQAGVPVQAHRKEWVMPQPCASDQSRTCSALFSLGVDVGPVGTAGANFVDSILHGAAPADLAVQEVPKVEFALSMRRADELGLIVPQDVIAQAEPLVYR